MLIKYYYCSLNIIITHLILLLLIQYYYYLFSIFIAESIFLLPNLVIANLSIFIAHFSIFIAHLNISPNNSTLKFFSSASKIRFCLPVTSRPSTSSSFANRIPIVQSNGKSIPAVHTAANAKIILRKKKHDYTIISTLDFSEVPIAVKIPAI